MEIRLIRPDEKDQLVELMSEFWKDHIRTKTLQQLLPFAAYKNIDGVILEDAEKFLTEEYATYVAEDEEGLIGFISGTVKLDPKKILDKAGYIENWFVKEGFRKNRVGTRLWDSIENYFKLQNCTHLLLDTWSENADAREIYSRKGFIEETIFMVKKL